VADKLYLVRHGQTESSARRAYSGRSDIALTAEGQFTGELDAQYVMDRTTINNVTAETSALMMSVR